VQVQGPDGPLVLAVLRPKVSSLPEGSAQRILLLDRTGLELDRRDAVIPGSSRLVADLEEDGTGGTRVRLRFGGIGRVPEAPLVLTTPGGEDTIPKERWPSDWRERGLLMTEPRDGRLQTAAP
jgi:hypothetical protein